MHNINNLFKSHLKCLYILFFKLTHVIIGTQKVWLCCQHSKGSYYPSAYVVGTQKVQLLPKCLCCWHSKGIVITQVLMLLALKRYSYYPIILLALKKFSYYTLILLALKMYSLILPTYVLGTQKLVITDLCCWHSKGSYY